ncbi:UNVERIFIED_CONTAM: hypothetical protein Sradi_5847200 [Sesamum radiatum]|uniref:RNase H type-1 domain-containing protein n=1 Tax=Sesamum radiatum TaxID=300843 RepID=A0AAW2KQP8_SESRA
MSAEWELSDDLPDENILMIEVTPSWKMYFDGVSHKERTGSGVVFVISEGEVLPYSFTLTQNCLNNVVEYQALILGLEITVDSKQLPLKVYGDSQLVVNELLGLYEAKMLDLLPYYKYAKKLMGWLGDVELKHLPRKDNKQADALAKLVSTLSMTDKEPIVTSWPFDAWGLDIVGPMTKSSRSHLNFLAVIDYFSKWAEAVTLKEVKKENVADFICTYIIYSYGVLRNSSMYYDAANGLAEAFNKTLCNLLKKVVAKLKRDWHERIGEALWAYKTTIRTPTQATPYALIYGVETVLPLEQQIPSLRIAIQELTEKKMLKYDLKN